MSGATFLESDSVKLRRRNRELSILNSIAEALNRSVNLDEAVRSAVAQVASLLVLHTGWVWLLDEDSDESYLAASQNLPPALTNNPRRMEGACYCLDSYRVGDMDGAANVNVVTCSRLKSLVDGTDGLRYHASIPLYASEKKLGVLNVASSDWQELSGEDLQLLHTIGDLLSIAIERARLYEKSTQLGIVEERNRLTREIHDTLAQGLTAVTLQLESADAFLEGDVATERAREKVRQALVLTRANLEEARRSVLDLRAAPLEGRTLAEALELLVESMASPAGLGARFEATAGYRPLPARVETTLYRIAQEALAEVTQHAHARQVAVQLVTTPDEVRLIVEDDGRGSEPTDVAQERFGLLGMNKRVRLLGGQMHVESSSGAGTRIIVSVILRS